VVPAPLLAVPDVPAPAVPEVPDPLLAVPEEPDPLLAVPELGAAPAAPEAPPLAAPGVLADEPHPPAASSIAVNPTATEIFE
jgi:hypothetical protein